MQRFHVEYGHRAVWINDRTGCCLGRFGQYGIDVHRSLADQEAGNPQCLFCTHGTVGADDWRCFIAAMNRHHAIDLRAYPVPDWVTHHA